MGGIKMLKKAMSMMLVAAVTMSLMAGCAAKAEETSAPASSEGAQAAEKMNIAVIVKGTEHPYWQTVKKGAEDAASEFDVDMYFTGAAGGEADINGQMNLVETAINQKVDGIVLAASDSKALVPVANKAADAGIPLVLIDSGLDTEKYISYATTNNEAAAYEVGKKLGELTDGKGTIAIVSFTPGAGSAISREKGFSDAIAELYPDMEIITTQYCDSDKAKAISITQDILTAHPDITAIYAANEPSVVGVGRGLKETGRDDVILVGFDSSDDIIPLLEEGLVRATAVQMPYQMGYIGVETIIKDVKAESYDRNVDTGATLVTPENMNDPESVAALYPLGK